ncbi:MAG: T9SS type A sorting domain-containing protein [Candidatus Eisenbacteria bacterium]
MLRQVVFAMTVVLSLLAFSSLGFGFLPPGKASIGSSEEVRTLSEPVPPSARAASEWRTFTATEGEDFAAAWNPVTGTPHRIRGKGIRIADAVTEANVAGLAGDFVRSQAGLLGADPGSLRLLTSEKHGTRWYVDYQQTYRGLDVVGGRVHVRLLEGGTVTTFGSDFYQDIAVSPISSLSEDACLAAAKNDVGFDSRTDTVLSTRLMVLPIARGNSATYYLAREVRLKIESDPAAGREPAIWRTYVDAGSGEILVKHNEIYYDTISGTVSGYIKPLYITDADQLTNFADHHVTITGYPQATADQTGHYSIEVGTGGMRYFSTAIKGRWAAVSNSYGASAAFRDSTPPGTQKDVIWRSTNSLASERNAYYHAWIAHDKIRSIDPAFTGMDRQTPVSVNQQNYCNAYWDGNGITFGAGQGSCQDLAMFADVMYHEYGHGIADKQYSPLAPSGAMHEAFADYYACTITGEPYIGEGIAGPGSYFRTIDNTLRYPDDLTGEVHDDGRILAGALWDLRESLSPDVHLADSLFHFARYGKADNFFDYYYDVLETDDDDGNLANGTPHYYQILDAFGKHGIGPGLYIDIAQTPVQDSEDSTSTYPVVATITSNMALDPDSLLLHYSIDGTWTVLTMVPTANPNEYSAAIPHQRYGKTVSYYIYAKADGRSNSATSPAGAPSVLHVFGIGRDTIAPTIAHTPLGDQPDAGWPSTVAATVTDNLGLASVTLEYSKNAQAQPAIAMTRVEGTNDYRATFAVAASAGDYIEYRIVAIDASAAANTSTDPPASYHVFVIADAYYYAFETGVEGWTHYAANYWTDQWHLSATRNHTPGGGTSWRCGDTGTGDYAAHLHALLETPTVQIGPNSQLTFWYWMDAESYLPLEGSGLAWDGGALSLVDSAGKATVLDPVGGYTYEILADSDAPFTAGKPVYSGHESGWRMALFDLSRYQGSGKIRFKFGSDMAVGFEGWYIDDVMIWSSGTSSGVGGLCDNTCQNPGLPVHCSLGNALPNPASGRTGISYSVASPGSHVAIRVFDVRGRLAANLVDETKIPGRYAATWDGRDLSGAQVSPGIYFIRMETKNFKAASKLVLVR